MDDLDVLITRLGLSNLDLWICKLNYFYLCSFIYEFIKDNDYFCLVICYINILSYNFLFY